MIKIIKEELKDGTIRWRARGVSAGTDPATGKRRQRTVSGRTKKAVEAEVARITGQVSDGTYTARWDGSVSQLCDDYLASACFEKEANTALSYTKALLPVRERLGQRKARSVTRQDVEQLRDWMLTSGRRRGGRAGTGLGPRSVRLTMAQTAAAFEHACQDGHLAANPCRYVKLPRLTEREDTTWSEQELKAFLTEASGTRLHACWLLSALGLRRGEVLGLRWSDISFTKGTLTIRRARVLVNGKVITKDPKSRRSWRVLPLSEPLAVALDALQTRQREEMEAAGPAYANSGYVAADELGAPLYPEVYSDQFGALCKTVGLPRIRLHDCRATMNGLLEQAGVADSFRAAWLGHSIQINRRSYTPQPKELTVVSDLVGGIFSADVA